MGPRMSTDHEYIFPSPHLANPEGLLAVGGDLNPQRILSAYRQGIFPWYAHPDPILWWSPDPRMVLIPQDFKPSHSLHKRLKQPDYQVRFNTAFENVIHACATTPRRGQTGTWLTPSMIAAYTQLHQMGFAHSVETWMDGKLVGGLYGLAIGRVFFGESMFSTRTDASKLAFAHLVERLCALAFGLLDCQVYTPHLASLGAKPIPRTTFLEQLSLLTPQNLTGKEQVFPGL